MAIRVCFVCLGNICRSPTGEGVLSALVRDAGLEGRVRVDSAGTAAYHVGERADARSRRVAADRGVEITGRARRFTASDFDRFDYVIAMDRENERALRGLTRSAADARKIRRLRSFEPGASHPDVPDPYYGGDDGFDRVFEICLAACRGLLDHLVAEHDLA